MSTTARCIVAYHAENGTILGVHMLPAGELPPGLSEEHFHTATRSHVAMRSGVAETSVTTMTAEADRFSQGKKLHVDTATGKLLESSDAAAEFGSGSVSSVK